jgi:hypothetical protein
MKYTLSIIAIFKNEKWILEEWLEHYIAEGVDHFYLIDNGSTDDYQPIIEPYIKEKIVDIKVDARPHMQVQHYNSYLDVVKKESEWVMIVDLDEFIYSRDPYMIIPQYLLTVSGQVGQIHIPWKLFGSNGFLTQPQNCLDHFIIRTSYDHVKTNGMHDTELMLTKTIIRTKYLVSLSIHYSNISKNSLEITSDNQPISTKMRGYQCIDEKILSKSKLHCNHYPIQSFDWFRQIKMNRGSAYIAKNDKVRTIDYYNSFDSHANQLIDTELSNKRNQFRVYYGVDIYRDVTRLLLKSFMKPSSNQIVISDDVNFNQYFGDPNNGKVKYLIVRQNNQLKIYPETDHGEIIITL